MDISIDERSLSLRTEYDISTPGQDYFAQKKFFSLTNQIDVGTAAGEAVASLQSHPSLFHLNYDFNFANGCQYSFRCIKAWKGVYTCGGNGQSLTVYQRKGLKWSIFECERQIAAFTKNRVVFGNGNRYDVRINSDANHLLAISIVLALSVSDDQNTRRSRLMPEMSDLRRELSTIRGSRAEMFGFS